MRHITVTFVGILVFGALAFAPQNHAVAQMPPATPPPVPSPTTPDTAIEGTIASMTAGGAVLQTPDGQSVQLSLNRGYLLVDPSPQALGPGMRVFAIGPNQNGNVAVDEIDVLFPLNLMTTTPTTAATPAPSPVPTPT